MPLEIFIAYSHSDTKLKSQLLEHLSSLSRTGLTDLWHDRCIPAGKEWEGEIDEHLNSSDVILLLVSSSFINSDYCVKKEMAIALERAGQKEAIVVPVILRPCVWESMGFGKLQALPKNGKAVTDWKNRDKGYTAIVHGLQDILATENQKPVGEHSQSAVVHDLEYYATANPKFVANEGFTERSPEIYVEILPRDRSEGHVSELALRIYVNTSITNHISQDGTSNVELVDENGVVLARGAVKGNEVSFENVQVKLDRRRSLCIRHLILNANGVEAPGMIVATPVIEGRNVKALQQTRPYPVIAIPTQALNFWASDASFVEAPTQFEANARIVKFHVYFSPRFPQAFSYRVQHGIGTRLKINLLDLPEGASLWAGTAAQGSAEIANLVLEEYGDYGLREATGTFAGIRVAKLPVKALPSSSEGLAISKAIWEVDSPLPSEMNSYEFPIYVQLGQALTAKDLSEIVVIGTLAPSPSGGGFTPTTASAASSKLPVLRYSDVFASIVYPFCKLID